MIKYVPEMTNVVLEEIPDRLTLAIDISNCTGLCEGCHSPFLRRDVGVELTPGAIDSLIADNFGINCFLFLGEGNDHAALMSAATYIRRSYPSLELGIYSGRESVEDDVWELFDFVKIGPFRPSCGPLNKTTTNQRLYHVIHNDNGTRTVDDITARFWHRGIESTPSGKSCTPSLQ